MSWLAISTGRRSLLTPESVGCDTRMLVPSGSLVIEATFTAEPEHPQVLLDLDRTAGWHRAFRITLRADGELFIEQRQNREVTCALLDLTRPDHDAPLRLTYSWNGPARQGLLTVENLDTDRLDQVSFDQPQPWPVDDISALVAPDGGCRIDEGVTLLAVSDHIEAVGLPPGLQGETLVETATGHRPVQELQRGDLVMTSEHGWQPVRWIISRELPAAGRFAPIRLLAPFFGLGCDLEVAQDHRILIEGADTEYLFGADSVLVEARHLAAVSAGTRQTTGPTVSYVQVILDNHDCISASETWVESLYLGEPAERPRQLAATGLSGVPAHLLPRHGKIASPLLKSYEAVVLVSSLCA